MEREGEGREAFGEHGRSSQRERREQEPVFPETELLAQRKTGFYYYFSFSAQRNGRCGLFKGTFPLWGKGTHV